MNTFTITANLNVTNEYTAIIIIDNTYGKIGGNKFQQFSYKSKQI